VKTLEESVALSMDCDDVRDLSFLDEDYVEEGRVHPVTLGKRALFD
jgi:hypothetical protein